VATGISSMIKIHLQRFQEIRVAYAKAVERRNAAA
jgi:hypothetical protein